MIRISLLAVSLALSAASAAPVAAALITNVVEVGGDNEATDTIAAKWSGVQWNVTIADEPVPGALVGGSYTAGLFQHLAPAFVDRNHRYVDDVGNNLPIPAYLAGGEYILSGNDNRDNTPYRLDVTVSGPATVYMLIDNRLSDGNGATPPTFDATHMQWFDRQPWIATSNGSNRGANPAFPDEIAFDEGADDTINQYYSVYKRVFGAGTFSLREGDNAGQNMYGVVIKPASPDEVPVTGDVNGDRLVNIQDFGIIRDHFRTGTTVAEGDLSFDGQVNFDDFEIWKNAFGAGAPASVPEPSAVALTLVALLGLAGCVRMKRAALFAAMLALSAAFATSATAANITNVVETGGDNEATDTITAKWTGVQWPVTVANEPVPGAVVGGNYTTGLFDDLAPAFVDRNHRYAGVSASNTLPIPGYLVGNEYIMSGNDNRDNPTYRLDVTIASAATVYMLIDNRLSDTSNANPPTFDATHMQWILDQAWIPTANGLNRAANAAFPDEVAFDEGADGTINQYYSVYAKDFPAGTFSLLQADNAGQNMYGVVVKAGSAGVVGDVNGDQIVDIADFDLIRLNFRTGTTPEQGDLDFSGLVDLADFKIWKNAFSGPGAPASVPEPSAWALLCVGVAAAGLVRCRRRCIAILACALVVLSNSSVSDAQSTIVFTSTGQADWNLQSSWVDPIGGLNYIPGDGFPNEVPGINNGGTAFLSSAALFPVGGVILGEGGGFSGRLEIRSLGSLVVEPAEAPAANGSVTVGQAGTGHLAILGGGLTAVQLNVGGAAGSSLVLSDGELNITGNANLDRMTRMQDSDFTFQVGGNLRLGGRYEVGIYDDGVSAIQVTGSANVGGALRVDFPDVTPGFGDAWQLVNAASATGRFASVTSSPLARGLVLEQSIDQGGSGDVGVRVGNRLVLSVDRKTGAARIENVVGDAISFDGYAIGSAAGTLNSAAWNSLEDKNLGDWVEASPTANNLSELNPLGGSSLSSTQNLQLGNPYQFTPTAFGQTADDLTFDYSLADGDVVQGLVEYTGPHNTLVLVVDPATGASVLQNQSSFSATIDGYTISSASGSLSSSAWESLQDGGAAGWQEANPTANNLSELHPTGGTLFTAGLTVELGAPFNRTGVRDLTLEFHLTNGETLIGAVEYGEPISIGQNGDTDGDGDVDLNDLNAVRNNFGSAGPIGGTPGDAFPFDGNVNLDDLNGVRNNFGATAGAGAVPEPSSLGLAVIVATSCLAVANRRRKSGLAVQMPPARQVLRHAH